MSSANKKRVAVKQEETENQENNKKAQRVSNETEGKRVAESKEEQVAGGGAPDYIDPPPVNPFVKNSVDLLLKPDKAEFALKFLNAMVLGDNPKVREELRATNICENIVHVMQGNTKNPDVLSIACRLMVELTYEDVEFTEGFLNADAARTVVEAMIEFPQFWDLQRCGSDALCNISHYCVDQNGAKKLVDAGGIETLTSAMKRYPGNADIQRSSCACLHNLAISYSTAIPEIIEKGGIHAVVFAMGIHPEHEEVNLYACHFHEALIRKKPETKALIEAVGGGVALAKVKFNFENDIVLRRASQALKALYG